MSSRYTTKQSKYGLRLSAKRKKRGGRIPFMLRARYEEENSSLPSTTSLPEPEFTFSTSNDGGSIPETERRKKKLKNSRKKKRKVPLGLLKWREKRRYEREKAAFLPAVSLPEAEFASIPSLGSIEGTSPETERQEELSVTNPTEFLSWSTPRSFMMARQLDRIEYYLKTGKYPADVSGRSNRGDKSNFRRATKPYALVDGKLMYKYALTRKVKSPELLRVIKDVSERQELLQAAHEVAGTSSPADGCHLGRDKTHAKLIEAGVFWPDMNKDVRQYVKTCSFCGKGDNSFGKAASELQSAPVGRSVWERVEVDSYSLMETPEGYTGILMVWDHYSKWLEAKPIKNACASDVADFLYELICRHGYPRIQINDQSQAFVDAVKERLLCLTGFDLRITCAHHPQEYGPLERAHGNGLGTFLKILSDDQEGWPDRLLGVLFAYRTTPQVSTGLTPFELLYGRAAVIPRRVTNDDADETGFTADELVEVKIESVDEVESEQPEFITDIKIEVDDGYE